MTDPRIAWTVDRMAKTLPQRLPLAAFADAINLSTSRFAHLFREQTGVPPARYLHALRMQRARTLVEDTFLSIKEVMLEVGFSDPSHFARDFRRFHGCSPTELRRSDSAASVCGNWSPIAR